MLFSQMLHYSTDKILCHDNNTRAKINEVENIPTFIMCSGATHSEYYLIRIQ